MTIQSKRVTGVISYPAEHVVNNRVCDALGFTRMNGHPWWDRNSVGDVREQVITGVLAQMVRQSRS